MPNTISLSGDIGPGGAISDISYSSPKSVKLDFLAMTVTVEPQTGPPVTTALTGVTTITDTISSNVHAIAIDK